MICVLILDFAQLKNPGRVYVETRVEVSDVGKCWQAHGYILDYRSSVSNPGSMKRTVAPATNLCSV